jgi:hypothetical protein
MRKRNLYATPNLGAACPIPAPRSTGQPSETLRNSCLIRPHPGISGHFALPNQPLTLAGRLPSGINNLAQNVILGTAFRVGVEVQNNAVSERGWREPINILNADVELTLSRPRIRARVRGSPIA